MNDSDSTDNARPFSAVPKPEPEESESSAKDTRSRRRFLDMPEGALGFFILWLLAAAGGGLIVNYWPWMSGTGTSDNAAVNDRLAVLETRIGQIAAGHAPQAAAASFEEERRNLAALKSHVDADEARLAALESAADGPGGIDAAALDKNASDLAQIAQRLNKLEQLQAANGPQLAARIAVNEKALVALRTDLDTQTKTNGDALGKLSVRMDEAEKRLAPADLAERLDNLTPKSSVTGLETRLARLENRDTADLIRRASSLLALADLMRASEREGSFAGELGIVRALVPDSPEIADLSRYAKKGVPAMTVLTQHFSQEIDSILAAERTARAHNPIERVWFGMMSLVAVRRLGNIPGNDTEAHIARAEFALKRGDLAAAVAEVDRLNAPARAVAAVWLKDAHARLAVDGDTRALTSRIVGRLASASLRQPSPPTSQPSLPK